MMLFLRLFRESYLFALQAIVANKLRTILTLSGITIGIFAIISVFTVFDSLENKIKTSIESLGSNVVFVQKWPWGFGGDYPWWKYLNRPQPKYQEMVEIEKRSQAVDAVCYMIFTSRNAKFMGKTYEGVSLAMVSKDYDRAMFFELEKGRYFTMSESNNGRPVAIIGADVAKELFGDQDPLGNEIRVSGRKLEVIGVFKKEGSDKLGDNNDSQVLIPVNYARTFLDIDNEMYQPTLVVRAKKGISNTELKSELTGILRTIRKLKPTADDNFAINEPSLITQSFEGLFNVISLIGWVIGGFSLLVGGFGIANIMFVSVRERTNIIGIQKSIGAKNYFILLQFLFEAVFLSLFGGLIGLLLVYLGTLVVTYGFDFSISLTFGNIFLGISVSLLIGLISGFIPAWSASRLNPVDAIRYAGQ